MQVAWRDGIACLTFLMMMILDDDCVSSAALSFGTSSGTNIAVWQLQLKLVHEAEVPLLMLRTCFIIACLLVQMSPWSLSVRHVLKSVVSSSCPLLCMTRRQPAMASILGWCFEMRDASEAIVVGSKGGTN